MSNNELAELIGRADGLGLIEPKAETVRKLIQAAYWRGALESTETINAKRNAEQRH